MVFASQFQNMTSHQYCNGNLAIILSLMSFSFITHFLSFGSLVGIRRPFRNAADDGGYKRHFCACSNLASSRSERLKYVLNIFEIFSKCSWWWWLTRDVFVPARIGIVPVWTFEISLKYFWNAAGDGGWQATFLCLLEFGIVPVWTFEIWLPRLIIRSTSKGESTNGPSLIFFNFSFPKKLQFILLWSPGQIIDLHCWKITHDVMFSRRYQLTTGCF